MSFGEQVTLEELERDSYPIYRRLRDEEPVSWVPVGLARVSLDILLDRLPKLRLDLERPPTLRGWEFRAPDSMWVQWGAP